MLFTAYVRFSPTLLKNSMSTPNSVSARTSGLRFGFPSVVGESTPPAPMANVAYCAAKLGRCPVWP